MDILSGHLSMQQTAPRSLSMGSGLKGTPIMIRRGLQIQKEVIGSADLFAYFVPFHLMEIRSAKRHCVEEIPPQQLSKEAEVYN